MLCWAAEVAAKDAHKLQASLLAVDNALQRVEACIPLKDMEPNQVAIVLFALARAGVSSPDVLSGILPAAMRALQPAAVSASQPGSGLAQSSDASAAPAPALFAGQASAERAWRAVCWAEAWDGKRTALSIVVSAADLRWNCPALYDAACQQLIGASAHLSPATLVRGLRAIEEAAHLGLSGEHGLHESARALVADWTPTLCKSVDRLPAPAVAFLLRAVTRPHLPERTAVIKALTRTLQAHAHTWPPFIQARVAWALREGGVPLPAVLQRIAGGWCDAALAKLAHSPGSTLGLPAMPAADGHDSGSGLKEEAEDALSGSDSDFDFEVLPTAASQAAASPSSARWSDTDLVESAYALARLGVPVRAKIPTDGVSASKVPDLDAAQLPARDPLAALLSLAPALLEDPSREMATRLVFALGKLTRLRAAAYAQGAGPDEDTSYERADPRTLAARDAAQAAIERRALELVTPDLVSRTVDAIKAALPHASALQLSLMLAGLHSLALQLHSASASSAPSSGSVPMDSKTRVDQTDMLLQLHTAALERLVSIVRPEDAHFHTHVLMTMLPLYRCIAGQLTELGPFRAAARGQQPKQRRTRYPFSSPSALPAPAQEYTRIACQQYALMLANALPCGASQHWVAQHAAVAAGAIELGQLEAGVDLRARPDSLSDADTAVQAGSHMLRPRDIASMLLCLDVARLPCHELLDAALPHLASPATLAQLDPAEYVRVVAAVGRGLDSARLPVHADVYAARAVRGVDRHARDIVRAHWHVRTPSVSRRVHVDSHVLIAFMNAAKAVWDARDCGKRVPAAHRGIMVSSIVQCTPAVYGTRRRIAMDIPGLLPVELG